MPLSGQLHVPSGEWVPAGIFLYQVIGCWCMRAIALLERADKVCAFFIFIFQNHLIAKIVTRWIIDIIWVRFILIILSRSPVAVVLIFRYSVSSIYINIGGSRVCSESKSFSLHSVLQVVKHPWQRAPRGTISYKILEHCKRKSHSADFNVIIEACDIYTYCSVGLSLCSIAVSQ